MHSTCDAERAKHDVKQTWNATGPEALNAVEEMSKHAMLRYSCIHDAQDTNNEAFQRQHANVSCSI